MSRALLLLLPLVLVVGRLGAQETVFHYSFVDGEELTTVFDTGPAGNNATGQVGAALSLDIPTEEVPDDLGDASLDSSALGGLVTDNVSLLTNELIVEEGGFVMECWFKWNGAGVVNSIIDYAGTEKIVLAPDTGTLGMLFNSDAADLVPIGNVTPGEWHYVAVVFDTLDEPLTADGFATGTVTCYLDSFVPAAVQEGVEKTLFGDGLIRSIGVGQHPNGFPNDFFDGLVYEPRVTLGVLDPEDLLLQARIVDPPSTLLAYRFSSEDALPAIPDQGDAGNDATAAAGAALSDMMPPADVPDGGDSSLDTAAGGAVTDAGGLLSTTAIGNTSGFTMEGWLLWSGDGGGSVIESAGGNGVRVDASGQVLLVISDADTIDIGQAVEGEWHWFGAVFDTASAFPDGDDALIGTVTTYFDGLDAPVVTPDIQLDSTDGGAGIGVGQKPDGSGAYPGLIYAPTVSLGPLAAGALSYVVPPIPVLDPVTVFRYSEIDPDIFPDVPDSSGSENHGTAQPAAVASEEIPEDGVPDDAGDYSLDSRLGTRAVQTGIVTNAISLLTNELISEYGGFTMECWFQWDGTGGVNSIIDYAGTEKIVIDERNGDNFGMVKMRISGTLEDLPIEVATPLEWHYVAVVFATGGLPQNDDGTIGGTVTVYFDDTDPIAVHEGATKNNFGDSLARPIGVGQHPIGFDLDFFQGLVFEPRVTLGPLAPSELLYGAEVDPPDGPTFLRGDCNGDGNVVGQVGDAIFTLNFNFLGGPAPACMAACDSNGDGNVIGQVGDAIYTLNFNFLGGPTPTPPFPECGVSEEPGDVALGCETSPCDI